MTKRKLELYFKIQKKGLTNMFNIKNVIDLSGNELTKNDCLNIMKNYKKYKEKFDNFEFDIELIDEPQFKNKFIEE